MQSCDGRTLAVLFEKPGRKPGQAVGRSPYLQPVHVEDAAHLIGEIRDVTIDARVPEQPQRRRSRMLRAKRRWRIELAASKSAPRTSR